MNSRATTLVFKSNLYPVSDDCSEDRKFLSKIHDPFSLEEMHRAGLPLTGIQRKEYSHASLHCVYAYENDYPWGTVSLPEGKAAVVCKCTKVDCIHFETCRPDFDPNELNVYDENLTVKKAPTTEMEPDDSPAAQQIVGEQSIIAEQVFSEPEPEKKHPAEESIQQNDPPKDDSLFFQDPSVSVSQQNDAARPVVSFSSFTDTTQDTIIKEAPSKRVVVNAGPGTGKTWTLVERIINLVSEQGVSSDTILVFCFSRAAVKVVKNRLAAAASKGRIGSEWREIDIRTFDSFATYLLAWVQSEMPEMLPRGFNLEEKNYEQRIIQATQILETKKDLLVEYEQIIVDEVQDIVGARAGMVLALLSGLPESCGFTILGDYCQAIYDYLEKDNPSFITSEKFYAEIFKLFPYASFYSLTENHRQGDQLGALTIPYRQSILTGNADARTENASELLGKIPAADIRLQKFDKAVAVKYLRQGTLGILTRTNGQALQISAWLRNEEIPHVLQRSMGTPDLCDWVAIVFCNYSHETMDESNFITSYQASFPGTKDDTARRKWFMLLNAMPENESRQRYEVRDILSALIRNARDPELFQSDDEKPCAITISNIHQAKGQEFDTVIVLDDVIQSLTESEEDNIQEHKVCYVALTRPKKRIEHVGLPTQYIYITQNEARRCSKASRPRPGKKPYISHFEVGADDLDRTSFAESQERQDYIRSALRPGTRLKLKKCPEGQKPYVSYSVVVEDQEKTILGYTGRVFAEELESAIQRIFKTTYSIRYEYYPHAFCDVYVGMVTSCVSGGSVPAGAKTFGDVSVWSGFTITGFAAVDRDTY